MALARVLPLPFVVGGSAEIVPMTFVSVDMVTGLCIPSIDLATTHGIADGNTTVAVGDALSVWDVKGTTGTFFMRCGGTVTKGMDLMSDANGLAIDGAAAGVVRAMEAGVANQIIEVISMEAF